jgi:GT2 family glycosyltransferase
MLEQPPFSHETRAASEGSYCVVLVHYGAPDATRRCLESLATRESAPHDVIVVDHGPGPGLREALEGVHPRCRILTDPANPGFGAGCNRGAREAFADGAEAVWFLNNDAILADPLLERLGAWARAFPGVALWGTQQAEGGRLLGTDHQPRWYAEGLAVAPLLALPEGCLQLSAAESLSGASLFVSRMGWERLGPWPEDFFLYFEDAAWCRRAHALGLPLVLVQLAVRHERGTTTGHRSPLTTFYGTRNALRLHREIHPEARWARVGMALHLLQKRFFQGRWGLLKPTWDAVRTRGRGRDPRY